MANILICDDERDIVSALEIYLHADGYTTYAAYNGAQALEILAREKVHLVLMDIMMPGVDGLGAVAELRRTSNVPVIFLSAKSEDTDKILGLNLGADDYVTKPFNPVELSARVRSQLRRYTVLGGQSPEASHERMRVGGVELDERTKTVTLDGEAIALTPTEYEILKLFMQNPGRVMSPKEIYRLVWRDDPFGAESTVAVHIRHIREKIEIDPASPRYLRVVWGQGYKLMEQPPARGTRTTEKQDNGGMEP